MKTLTATFFATGELAGLPEAGIRAKVRECHECGFHLIVPTCAAIWGRSYAPSGVLPPLEDIGFASTVHGREPGRTFDPSAMDVFEVLLDECDRLGMGFFMPTGTLCPRKPGSGLAFAWRPREWFDASTRERSRRFILELAERYGGHAAFRGWYVTDEMKWGIAEYAPLVAAVAAACREARPALPVMMSPAPAHMSETHAGLGDPAQVALLAADVIAPMDLGGYTAPRHQPLSEEAWARVAESHRATAVACRSAGKAYWANIECFVYNESDPGIHGAPWSRIERQIACASECAEALICFEFFGLMDAPLSSWPLGDVSAKELYMHVGQHCAQYRSRGRSPMR